MAKNALISSPLFFGLLFLVLIAFESEGGGVSGVCIYGSGVTNIFVGKMTTSCDGCDLNYCQNLPLPAGYTRPNSGVRSFHCSNVAPRSATPCVCLCCVD
ncbi:hypothetical protein MKW94_029097 [Papaver nudicaule]|uniref:Uncharacterized protein n=1 Tax=Papaver nudicaule TaxID=74823 RepID=A0AA42B0J2_PAPNU|nr:hypothetical protein [Papaver nudicaule]